MLLVKLGGSVITDKSKLRTARPAVIKRLAKEATSSGDELILVHGAGSFGHIKADEHRLHEGYRDNEQLRALVEVQRDVRELNLRVLEALIDAGSRPVSIPPGIVVRFSDGRIADIDVKTFRDYITLGMVPVTFGDVVIDSKKRFAICSGDDLMLELCKAFKPERSLFVTDVDGVYTRDPKGRTKPALLKEVRAKDTPGLRFASQRGKDVTGGLEGKLRKMFEAAEFADESWILNGLVPGRLRDAVAGKPFTGTRVVK